MEPRPLAGSQDVTEVWRILAEVKNGSLDFVEPGHDSCNAQIGCLLRTVTARVSRGKVARVILPLVRQWLHMIDVQMSSLDLVINRFFANEAVASLSRMKRLFQVEPF